MKTAFAMFVLISMLGIIECALAAEDVDVSGKHGAPEFPIKSVLAQPEGGFCASGERAPRGKHIAPGDRAWSSVALMSGAKPELPLSKGRL